MGEYFKPASRKIGLLTLVMACVFAAGRVRSLVAEDKIVRYSGIPAYTEVESTHGYIIWWSSSKFYFPPNSSRLFWSDLPAQSNHPNGFNLDGYNNKTPRVLRQIGFGIGHVRKKDGGYRVVWAIPYWSMVLPLTLVSVWLLLSKPRKSIPKKIVEPIPEMVV